MNEIRLREWRAGDAAAITPVLEDPQIVKWSHIGELGPERWVAEQRHGRRGPSLAICDLGDEVLGKVALRLPGKASPAASCDAIRPEDQPVGELSYWVLPGARGRGVATAAARAMLELAHGIERRTLGRARHRDRQPRVDPRRRARRRNRRNSTRIESDRQGIPRELAVFIVKI